VANNHLIQFRNNASQLFGWQLSAIFGATPEQTALCNSFTNPVSHFTGPGNIVFDLLFVEQAVNNPLCLRTDCGLALDGFNIFIHVIAAVRNIFHIKLLNALVNKPRTWLVLCNTLNSARLKGFLLEDTTIGITCGLAGFSAPPNPDTGDDTVPAAGVLEVHNAASSHLSYELITLFNNQAQIASFCANFSTYSANIAGINLATDIVQATVCSYATQSLPNVVQLQQSFDAVWAEIFSTHIFVVSDSTQYLQFLCKGYTHGWLENFVPNLDNKDVLLPKLLAKCVGLGVADTA
jgi:hypothetical protein